MTKSSPTQIIPPPSVESRLLTVAEVCERLRISRWMFYRLLQGRQIESIKIGSRRLVPPSSLDALIGKLAAEERGDG